MKNFRLVLLASLVAGALTGTATLAQLSQSGWRFFAEVRTPATTTGIYKLTVPLQVIDKSRADLADLRLYDANQHEIPYALRIRREVSEQREITSTPFNQSNIGTTTDVSIDLGEDPGDHNEIQVETGGSNFRRRVDVEGSDSGKDWRILKTGDLILRFQNRNSIVESNRVTYPVSRYRFLRVRVFADEVTDRVAPVITAVSVSMSAREPGELNSWTASIVGQNLLRNQGAAASSWTIDLGGHVPCDRLSLVIEDPSFSRPFQVEAVDDPQNPRLVTTGELNRHTGEIANPLPIVFDHEEHAQKLRLLITDYSNQPLTVLAVGAAAPARELFFELKNPTSQSLRLFFGNTKAAAPHYDFEKELPTKLSGFPNAAETVTQTEVGSFLANPDYKAEPLPLTERVPWLIYLVLAASSIALALVLISLARRTVRERENAPQSDVRTDVV